MLYRETEKNGNQVPNRTSAGGQRGAGCRAAQGAGLTGNLSKVSVGDNLPLAYEP